MIEHVRNVGATVASVDDRTFTEASYVMAMLEARATALAMPDLDGEDFAALRALNEQLRDAMDAGAIGTFSDLNRQLHEYIYQRCPNRYLCELIALTWDRLQIGYQLAFVRLPLRLRSSIAEHDEIIDMLERRVPPGEIESAVLRHKLQTLEALKATPAESPVTAVA